jgi:hypothetical protein
MWCISKMPVLITLAPFKHLSDTLFVTLTLRTHPLIVMEHSTVVIGRPTILPAGKSTGLHYYVVVPKPNPTITEPFPGRCWAGGIVVVTFAIASKRSEFSCAASGTLAFHYGK